MKLAVLLGMACTALVLSCGPSKNAAASNQNLEETLENKNRVAITLMTRIRRLPGIALRSGVPVFTKNTNSISSFVPIEPLYVLDGYIVGNSFQDIDQLVDNNNVEKIEVLSDSDASFYGSRASNGVIKITTFQ